MRLDCRILTIILAGLFAGWSWAVPATNDYVKIRQADGSVYEGELKDGMFNGKGILSYPNGDRYEGTFINGLLNGTGSFLGRHGATYQGGFSNGEYSGTGVFIDAHRYRYEGAFQDGECTGNGELRLPSGTTYKGVFKDSRLNGTGSVHYPDGAVEEGEFRNGELNGGGRRFYANGTREEGSFKDGLLQGRGRTTSSAGYRYEGEFKKGQPEGHGVLYKSNGDEIEGEFENGKPSRVTVSFFQPARWIPPSISPFILLLFAVSVLLNLWLGIGRLSQGRFQPRLRRDERPDGAGTPAGTEKFERIAILDDESQAEALDMLLAERGIPHEMTSYHDTAFDGLYQTTKGWGHVEAPRDRAEDVLKAIKDLSGPPPDSEAK